jgi:hypothetical protein
MEEGFLKEIQRFIYKIMIIVTLKIESTNVVQYLRFEAKVKITFLQRL